MCTSDLPQPGDSLFANSGDSIADLTFFKDLQVDKDYVGESDRVGDKIYVGDDVYVQAYKRAGDVLVSSFEETPEWYREHELFMPAMFCYRHYAELVLKSSIRCGIVWDICPMEENQLKRKHELQTLWKWAKPVILEVWHDVDAAVLDSVTSLVEELHELDEREQNMRYGVDTKGRLGLRNAPDTLSLSELRHTMQRLSNFFERVSDEFNGYTIRKFTERNQKQTTSG